MNPDRQLFYPIKALQNNYDMSNVVINMGMGEKLLVAESHFIQSLHLFIKP